MLASFRLPWRCCAVHKALGDEMVARTSDRILDCNSPATSMTEAPIVSIISGRSLSSRLRTSSVALADKLLEQVPRDILAQAQLFGEDRSRPPLA